MKLLDSDFGHWLAGFIDGEGCFMIRPIGNGFVCDFSVRVRADEKPILEQIVFETGIGYVANDRGWRNVQGYISKPLAIWKISTKDGCCKLADLLQIHPLRAKKKADLVEWNRGLNAWKQVKHGQNNKILFDEMLSARLALHSGRTYDG